MNTVSAVLAAILAGFNWLLGRQKQQNEFTEAGRAESQRDTAVEARKEIDDAQSARQGAAADITAHPDKLREPDKHTRPWNPDATG